VSVDLIDSYSSASVCSSVRIESTSLIECLTALTRLLHLGVLANSTVTFSFFFSSVELADSVDPAVVCPWRVKPKSLKSKHQNQHRQLGYSRMKKKRKNQEWEKKDEKKRKSEVQKTMEEMKMEIGMEIGMEIEAGVSMIYCFSASGDPFL